MASSLVGATVTWQFWIKALLKGMIVDLDMRRAQRGSITTAVHKIHWRHQQRLISHYQLYQLAKHLFTRIFAENDMLHRYIIPLKIMS